MYLERFGVLDSDFEAVVVDEEGGVVLEVDRLEDLQLSVLKCSTFSCSMISFFLLLLEIENNLQFRSFWLSNLKPSNWILNTIELIRVEPHFFRIDGVGTAKPGDQFARLKLGYVRLESRSFYAIRGYNDLNTLFLIFEHN